MFFQKRFIKIIILLISLTLILSATPQEKREGFTFPEKNFKTAEAAIRHFVKGLAANDLASALEACAINEADRFDFRAFVKRLGGIPFSSLAPSQSLLFGQTNRLERLALLARQTKFMMYGLLLAPDEAEEIAKWRFIKKTDEAWIASFARSCDSHRLRGLTVVKIKPAHKLMNSERAHKIALAQAKVQGADDSTERIVLYRLNNAYYWGGMHLLKYGNYWRIDSLHSNYANTSLLGTLKRMESPVDNFDKFGE
jgi:hypothetical protein